MKEKVAYELIHLSGWFQRIEELTAHGRDQYLSDTLIMEAGDSLPPPVSRGPTQLTTETG